MTFEKLLADQDGDYEKLAQVLYQQVLVVENLLVISNANRRKAENLLAARAPKRREYRDRED